MVSPETGAPASAVTPSKRAVFAAVAQALLVEGFGIGNGDVGDSALSVAHGMVRRIDESFVRPEIQAAIAVQDLGMKGIINGNPVGFHQISCRFVVALAADALHAL